MLLQIYKYVFILNLLLFPNSHRNKRLISTVIFTYPLKLLFPHIITKICDEVSEYSDCSSHGHIR